MRIRAKFIGINSLGYICGEVYSLNILNNSIITRLDGTGKCKYSSIKSFLSSWTNIEILLFF